MDVILHIGAHRTASTSFQHYLHSGRKRLEQVGVGSWVPLTSSDCPGVVDPGQTPDVQFGAARERLRENLDRAAARGVANLVVSDQNVIATPQKLLADGRLYSGIGERMARYAETFSGRLSRIVFSIRSQDSFWSSVAASAVIQGQATVSEAALDEIAKQSRTWRDVVTDLACAVSGVEIQVQPFEVFGSLPEYSLAAMTGVRDLPVTHARDWMNRSPNRFELREALSKRGEDPDIVPDGDGRWHPFDRDQSRTMREAYADDLFWLRAGADGLAKFIDVTEPMKAGKNPPVGHTTRGQTDGKDDRRLA